MYFISVLIVMYLLVSGVPVFNNNLTLSVSLINLMFSDVSKVRPRVCRLVPLPGGD